MIDTHSHLFDESFKEDLDECIKRCQLNNINKVILVGFSLKTNKQVLELSSRYNIFYPTYGLHPSEASIDNKKNLILLDEFLSKNKAYAIGECGLDYYWVKDNKDIQKELFIGQIELAIKYDLPIIIHGRDATSDIYDILESYKGKIRGVMHCYSGSFEMAKRFINLGFYISLGGPVTYKNSKEPKEVACGIDIDKLLVETDCPYLTPAPFRGKRNESSYVKYTLEAIAELRGIDAKELERITEENSKRLFRL